MEMTDKQYIEYCTYILYSQMSTVMNMIVSMKEIESEISTQDSQMASLKVDASDLEAVKQVKGIKIYVLYLTN